MKNPGGFISALFGAALCLPAAGCSSAQPHFYTLAPVCGPPPAAAPAQRLARIEIYNPAITEALDRDVIVRRVGTYKVEPAALASWSEPPGRVIARVFAQDMNCRVPGSIVYLQNDAVQAPPDITIGLTVRHFELSQDSHVRIEGITSILREGDGKGGSGAAEALTLPFAWQSPKPVHGGVENQMAALSQGVAEWSQTAASAIASLPDSAPVHQASPAPEP